MTINFCNLRDGTKICALRLHANYWYIVRNICRTDKKIVNQSPVHYLNNEKSASVSLR